MTLLEKLKPRRQQGRPEISKEIEEDSVEHYRKIFPSRPEISKETEGCRILYLPTQMAGGSDWVFTSNARHTNGFDRSNVKYAIGVGTVGCRSNDSAIDVGDLFIPKIAGKHEVGPESVEARLKRYPISPVVLDSINHEIAKRKISHHHGNIYTVDRHPDKSLREEIRISLGFPFTDQETYYLYQTEESGKMVGAIEVVSDTLQKPLPMTIETRQKVYEKINTAIGIATQSLVSLLKMKKQ